MRALRIIWIINTSLAKEGLDLWQRLDLWLGFVDVFFVLKLLVLFVLFVNK